jgi:hypothetical protein
VELSHGSGTCLPQESKGSGTLSGSKAETNDDGTKHNINKKLHFLTLNISATDTFQARAD